MVEFGVFRLDAAKRELIGPSGAVDVPSRAFDLLLHLAGHPGEVLDKSAVMKAVWPNAVVEEGNLTRSVFELRRALGDDAADPRYITTIPGRGYQFIAPVRESSSSAAPPAVAPRVSRGTLYACLAGALLIAVIVGITAAYRSAPAVVPVEAGGATAVTTPASIAIMPFADLSSSHDMEYFAEGLAEELMSSLSKVRGLRIISRHSSFALKGTSDDARSIGEKLRVDTILEGAVRKEGDRIRITAQLTRTKDGVSLWAETYDRRFDDVLDIQGSIAQEVSAAFALVLQPSKDSARPQPTETALTADAEAYRAYLRGVYLLTRRYGTDPRPARAEFLRAVQRDSHFAKAYAMLARTYQSAVDLGIGDVAQQKALASAALQTALKIDPRIGDLWWVRLMFLTKESKDYERQVNDLERTVASNPTDVEPMVWLAHSYLALARRDEALAMFERAYSADPLSPMAIWNVAWWGYTFSGNRQRLLDLLDEMARLSPHDAQPDWTRSNLAFNEGRALDWDRWVARVIEIDPADFQNHAWLALDYARVGAFDAALHHVRICASLAPTNATCAYSEARTKLLSGDIVAARKTVQTAVARDPRNTLALQAQGELQYFEGDCAGALRSLAQARPELDQREPGLDLFHESDDAVLFAWCLRQVGETARVAEFNRAFNAQYAGPTTPGLFEASRARMAAAVGDRVTLMAQLEALAQTSSMEPAFVRHEPMIRPWLGDREIAALLDRFEARRAEWRRLLPKASTRVPVQHNATPVAH